MKKYFLLIAFLFTITQAATTITRVIPDPQHTKFAFDLHDVVLLPDLTNMKRHIFNKEILPLLINVCNIQLMSRMLHLAARNATADEYVLLFEEFNRPEISELVKKVASQQIANKEVVDLIKELKALGYEIDMASDIGIEHLHELNKNTEIQEILNLFNNKLYVDYTKKPVIQKPQKQYFENYLKNYNKSHKTIIFIDDQKKNVDAAEQIGMVSLHFKNIQLLRKDLEQLGIFNQAK